MYHSNYITLLLPRIFYDKIFWNIRHSELNIRFSKKMTVLVSIICGIFSRIIPKKIIYCSEKSIKFHEKKHFYSKNKTALINNGFSDKVYFSSKYLRSNFRKKNKIKKNDIILGFAGRYAKQKNINSLLLAFSKIIKNFDNVYLYMAGKDMGVQNKELVDSVTSLKLQNRVFFLNEQKKLVEFYNGIDLLLLTSHSESFPNVVAEAMLCSTPVLSSDVGCSKKIIYKYGFIMSHNNSETIVRNLKKILNLFKNKRIKWKSLKIKSQNHIKKNYSIKKMANSYLKEWVLN
jgi:glycosyltransferase involved in cell wall biosynthesis